LGDVDVKGRRPNPDRVEPAAEFAEDGPKQQPPQPLRGPARKPVGLVESLAAACLVDPPLDRRIEQPQSLGHDQEDRDLEVAEGPNQDGGLAADRIDDARPDGQRRDEPQDLLVQVR
jgi:hypothetical protein